MKTFIRISLATAVLGLALACSKDKPGNNDGDSFKSITPLLTEIIIPEKGSAKIDFQVQDPGFEFNFDTESPECKISLRLRGGALAEEYAITSIEKKSQKGIYSARIKYTGKEDIFKENLCLGMRLGSSSLIISKTFLVRSEKEIQEHDNLIKTGLPIVYINTDGGKEITSKDDYLKASIRVDGFGKYQSVEESPCSIRGRGNTTWTWRKKPYLVKMDSKTSFFGFPKHKRWVLLANFMDRTMMRNLIAYKIGSMTNLAWTPRCRSVELVLNGKHMGNYLFIEQIRVDKDRINIAGEKAYLLELDFHFDNLVQWINKHGRCKRFNEGIPFAIKNPDKDVLTEAGKTYIQDYIEQTASALYGKDFKDASKGYRKYLDTDSFIDYWIIFEVMGNHELGNPGSVYFHKDTDKKLVAGPIWDFDWGVLSYKTSPQAKYGLLNQNAIWYERLFHDPEFVSALRKRWKELLPALKEIPEFMETMRKELKKSSELNFAMWNPAEDASQNGGDIINGDENMTFDDAVELLKNNFEERLNVISSSLDKL